MPKPEQQLVQLKPMTVLEANQLIACARAGLAAQTYVSRGEVLKTIANMVEAVEAAEAEEA